MRKNISQIKKFFDMIRDVDVESVPPLYSVLENLDSWGAEIGPITDPRGMNMLAVCLLVFLLGRRFDYIILTSSMVVLPQQQVLDLSHDSKDGWIVTASEIPESDSGSK
jgi:hypothetical protein